jgi:hypothetical protein
MQKNRPMALNCSDESNKKERSKASKASKTSKASHRQDRCTASYCSCGKLGGGCCRCIVRLLGTNARLRYTGLGVVVVCTLVQFRKYRSACEGALMASRSVIKKVENDDDDDVSKFMLTEGNSLQLRCPMVNVP